MLANPQNSKKCAWTPAATCPAGPGGRAPCGRAAPGAPLVLVSGERGLLRIYSAFMVIEWYVSYVRTFLITYIEYHIPLGFR